MDGEPQNTAMCDVDCTIPECGDGIVNGAEQCDSADIGGQTCQSQGFDGGVVEISTNGGATWTDLGPNITQNGYTHIILTGGNNPIETVLAAPLTAIREREIDVLVAWASDRTARDLMASTVLLNTCETAGALLCINGRILDPSDPSDRMTWGMDGLHAERLEVPIPSVLRLRQFVQTPYRRRVALSRRAVMAIVSRAARFLRSRRPSAGRAEAAR